ncbi:Hypothetical protein, predicted transmembrane protein [Metamycoplasma auris 15026]|uniref:NERD domain-containing protein n=1 Tax=Metamycoplasma auris 15026 TaxID=1188233 RepID=N9UZK9_9BACT|nr:hypothetical protein [Metamycoplasma auris]ENY68612.1 Hypothetical protein, predicted transmembrane protein [Metamycoplasma auris 15026]
MDKQLIAILVIVYTFLFIMLVIDAIFIVLFFKRKRNKKNESASEVKDEKTKFEEELQIIKRMIPENQVINDAIFKKDSNLTFSSGKILINSYGLFVLKEINDEGDKIEGNFNQRQWILHKENVDYYTNNLFWDLRTNIKELIPFLPNNLPVIGILVFHSIPEVQLTEFPEYLLHTNINDLSSLMYEIKSKLQSIVTADNINKIIELLNNKRVKK